MFKRVRDREFQRRLTFVNLRWLTNGCPSVFLTASLRSYLRTYNLHTFARHIFQKWKRHKFERTFLAVTSCMNTSNLLKKIKSYQTWWANPSIQTTTRFFAMQCFARDGFHHDIPEIKTNLIKFISPKTTILIASANLIIFLLTKKCYNIPRWSYNM